MKIVLVSPKKLSAAVRARANETCYDTPVNYANYRKNVSDAYYKGGKHNAKHKKKTKEAAIHTAHACARTIAGIGHIAGNPALDGIRRACDRGGD